MFIMRRFVCALAVNLFLMCGAMFPDDKKPALAQDCGWGEKTYYLSMGSSSKKESEIAKIEDAMNSTLAGVPGIVVDRLTIRVVFGMSSNKDARFILRYKFDGNKERKPPKVKMFDALNFSSESQRFADEKKRKEWYEKNAGANILSDGDWGYDARHITILVYDPVS